MSDAKKKSRRESISIPKPRHNPLPEAPIWMANSLSQIVSATFEELFQWHPALVPPLAKQPKEIATP